MSCWQIDDQHRCKSRTQCIWNKRHNLVLQCLPVSDGSSSCPYLAGPAEPFRVARPKAVGLERTKSACPHRLLLQKWSSMNSWFRVFFRGLEKNNNGSDPVLLAVRNYFGAMYPGDCFDGIQVLSVEEFRTVLAAFYSTPGILSKPKRYRILAIANKTLLVEELDSDNAEPYRIQNYK